MFKKKFKNRDSYQKTSVMSSVKMNRATVLNQKFNSIKRTHNKWVSPAKNSPQTRPKREEAPKATPNPPVSKKITNEPDLDNSCIAGFSTIDPNSDF